MTRLGAKCFPERSAEVLTKQPRRPRHIIIVPLFAILSHMLHCPLSDLTVHLLLPSLTTTLPSLSTATVDCESNLYPRFEQAS